MIQHKSKNFIMLIIIFAILIVISSNQAFTNGLNVHFDLVVDDSRQQIYASNIINKSIDVYSTTTLQLLTSIDMGAEPHGIDIDPTKAELAVALPSSGEIAFIDLDTLQIITSITPEGSLPKPYDVIYGRPGRLYSTGNGQSQTLDYIHVFDSNTKTELGVSNIVIRYVPRLAITEDNNQLIVSVDYNRLYKFDISTDLITLTHSDPHADFYTKIVATSPDGEYIYTSFGQIWSGDLSTKLGNFDISGLDDNDIMLDQDIGYAHAKNRVFISIVGESRKSLLIEFDGKTFQRLRDYRFDFPIKAPRANQDGTKIFVSTPQGILSFSAILDNSAFIPALYKNYCANFFDDFSDPASGWPISDNSYVRTEYINGKYRVLSRQDGFLYLFRAPTCPLDNYSAEVDVKWAGETGNSYGIIFDIKNNFTSYYLFDINTDYQLFRLYRRDAMGFTQIAGPSFSSAINKGTASNNLKVIRSGNQITLFINGKKVSTRWDNGISGTKSVGIISSPYIQIPKSDARFDNFQVIYLPTTSTESQTIEETSGEIYTHNNRDNLFEINSIDLEWAQIVND